MTDEEIYQTFRKHILEYEKGDARYPYGWFTALLDAQKEIISESVQQRCIWFAEWVYEKDYRNTERGWYSYPDLSFTEPINYYTSEQLYQEFVEQSDI